MQIVGEFLAANIPDVSLKTVVKDESEWETFVDSICRSYGFTQEPNPIVYTIEGNFIGDGADFLEQVRTRYQKSLQLTGDQTRKRVQINVDGNEERMLKASNKETLQQKIDKFLEANQSSNLSKMIEDAFY